jgi:hypothetical protein
MLVASGNIFATSEEHTPAVAVEYLKQVSPSVPRLP